MEDTVEDTFQSYHLAEKTTDEPLIRVMALHALKYCERLFYLEEVEEIRVADANVYAGRRLHEKLDKGTEILTLEIANEDLGIRGKVDCVRRKSGHLMIYEHKKGRSKEGKEAWPGDMLQVLAYCLLLSEHTGEPVQEAHIRYHADNKTIKIPINPGEAIREVQAAVTRAHELRNSIERPPVSVPERLCRTCSLAPVCLPEEERFACQDKVKPQRLFPLDDDRRIIHITEQGCSVRKKGEQLIVYFPDENKKPKELPGMAISSLVLHGNIQISTQAIHFCAANEIGVHWLSFGGHYIGGLTPAGGVQRRNRQYKAFQNSMLKTKLAVRMAHAKVENQLRYFLRATRSRKDSGRTEEVEKKLTVIRGEIKGLSQIHGKLESVSSDSDIADLNLTALTDSIRGHEGMAGRLYFSLLPVVLNLDKEDLLYFDGRNRRPPKDPFNSLLSFGYSLIYKDCVSALIAMGLDPCFGFFHTPRSASYPLALDLMELFRVILWDIPVIGSVNRRQWTRDDFDITPNQVWLNSDGRRKAIQVYENRKQEKWKHPVLNYSLSYARTLELEARLLEKEWTGTQGLFAQLRLR